MAKNKKKNWYIVSSIVFLVSTVILFVNNTTDVLVKFGIPFNLNVIAWIGIGVSILWWNILVAQERFR